MASEIKQYDCNGLAGCVSQQRSRTYGVLVSIYRADQAGLDDDDGRQPWSTVCETHYTACCHRTLALARYHAPFVSWCECCQGTCPHPEHQKES